MKNFLSVNDVSDVQGLVDEALRMKAHPQNSKIGAGKKLGLIFMNPSLRTRISSQAAALNLGMEVIVLNTSGDSWQLEFEEGAIMNGKSAEHVKEAAAVMGQYFDVLGVRTFPSLQNREDDYSEKVLYAFVKYAGIPIVSLESATLHPLQSLADAITIYENSVSINNRNPRVVLMWAPHIKPLPQSVPNSFAQWMNAWGKVDFVISHPQGYELDKQFAQNAPVIYDQEEALKNADFIYVKNWSSVNDYGKILPVEENWMLTNKKLKLTNKAKVMHCLPVRRNLVLSDEVLESEASLVIEEAGNRVWAAQAVLSSILKSS